MKNRKRNFTREEGLAMASRYRASGMTQAKFAQAEGVTKSTAQYWILKARKELKTRNDSGDPGHFVEVVERETSLMSGPGLGVTMEFAAARMRFDALPPAEYVARIAVEMAKGLSC